MRKTLKLPSNFNRSLSVTARKVEDTLDDLETMLRARGIRKITSEVSVGYSESSRQQLLDAITEMRQANEDMVHTFELQKFEKDEEKIVRAAAAHLWVILSDSTAKGLRGFGKLSPDLGVEVDNHVNRLLTLLKQIQ